MPVLTEDIREYDEFLSSQVKLLKSLDFLPETPLWHYTSGAGLLGIIQSGTIYATQVSCLNDSSEIRYASSMFRKALVNLLPTHADEPATKGFLESYLDLLDEEPDHPTHAPSSFFVSCFAAQEDDLNQWRSYSGGENGYALGFQASGLFGIPNSIVARVNYDKALHEKVAESVAEATIRFLRDGVKKKRAETPEKWAGEFLTFWDPYITRLAPMVKDPGFSSENEYRIIHEFHIEELKHMKFVQKNTMMSRHLPLSLPKGGEMWVPRLPLTKLIVGPCRHAEISRISVDTLLRQMGYGSGKVVSSARPFQQT